VPDYTVRLRWTQDWGTPGHNPRSVDDRIASAIQAAGRYGVKGYGDETLTVDHRSEEGAGDQRIIVWRLWAPSEANLKRLIDRWTGGDEPGVTGGRGSFRPNVRLVNYAPG
jgi:hypothetical protein